MKTILYIGSLITITAAFFLATPASAQHNGWHWQHPVIQEDYSLLAVAVNETNTGIAVGEKGLIVSTIEDGDTWRIQKSGTTKDLKDVFYTDSLTTIAVGESGTILRTTDGGETWVSHVIPSEAGLLGVDFLDAHFGIVVGAGGVIMTTASGGAITSAEQEVLLGQETPGGFVLEQNYPNPFNPTTTISYTLPEIAEVRLTVHDLLGRSLKVIVSGAEPAGRYEVVFDAAGLPSGAYFYRLVAGQYVETKRMVLVK